MDLVILFCLVQCISGSSNTIVWSSVLVNLVILFCLVQCISGPSNTILFGPVY